MTEMIGRARCIPVRYLVISECVMCSIEHEYEVKHLSGHVTWLGAQIERSRRVRARFGWCGHDGALAAVRIEKVTKPTSSCPDPDHIPQWDSHGRLIEPPGWGSININSNQDQQRWQR